MSHTHAKLIIIGSGPAGYTAAVYAAGLVIARGFAEGLDHAWFIRGLGWTIAFGGLWLAGRI